MIPDNLYSFSHYSIKIGNIEQRLFEGTCQELGGTSSVNKNSQNESAQSAPTLRVLVENELKKAVFGLWVIKFSPLFRSRNTFLVRGIQNPSMILS